MAYLETINVMNVRKYASIPVARLATRYRKLIDRPIFSEEIGNALIKAGLIEYVTFGAGGMPTRFRETDAMRAIHKDELESRITQILKNHFNLK